MLGLHARREVFVVIGPRQHLREVLLEDSTQHPLGNVFRRWVGHEDDARTLLEGRSGRPIGRRVPFQNGVLSRLQLTAVEELHLSGDKQGISLPQLAVEPRLPRPRNGDHPSFVLEHSLEDPQATACRDDSFATNPSYGAHVHTDLETSNRLHRGCVVVATRDVVEEIACGRDPESCEGVGALGAYTLQELDRPIEVGVAHPKTASTKPSMSNDSRS